MSHSIESHLHQISQPSAVQDKHPFVTLTLHPCHQNGPDPLKSHYTSVHPHYHHTRCIQRLKFRPAISPTRLPEYNNNRSISNQVNFESAQSWFRVPVLSLLELHFESLNRVPFAPDFSAQCSPRQTSICHINSPSVSSKRPGSTQVSLHFGASTLPPHTVYPTFEVSTSHFSYTASRIQQQQKTTTSILTLAVHPRPPNGPDLLKSQHTSVPMCLCDPRCI